MLCMSSTLLLLLPTLALASKSSGSKSAPGAGCTGTISSLDDVSAALKCQTININSFTIPGGKTLNLKSSLDNVVINLLGDLVFEVEYWRGSLMIVGGNNLQLNGGGNTINANGQEYWDNKGSKNGRSKPSPTLHIIGGGLVQDLTILNTPAQAVSIQNSEPLLVRNVLVDDRAGDALGRNTDGFGVSSSTGLTIDNCTVYNQDDCIALNSANNTVINNVNCYNGHGISIGSMQSNQQVTNVRVENSNIVNSEQCIRVKAFPNLKNSLVQKVRYSGNTEHAKVDTKTSLAQVPSTEMQINDIEFTGTNNLFEVEKTAWRFGGTCALGKCNRWNFESLVVKGGTPGVFLNTPIDDFVHSSSGSEGSKSAPRQPAPGDGSTDSSKSPDPSSHDKSGNGTAGSPADPNTGSTPLATPLPKTHQNPKSKHHGQHQGHGSHTHTHRSLRLAKRRLEDIAYQAK